MALTLDIYGALTEYNQSKTGEEADTRALAKDAQAIKEDMSIAFGELEKEMFKGPVPSPEKMEKYEHLYPGAVKFFFETLKNQTNHRIELEKEVIRSNIKSERRGSWFGFIITMTTIISGLSSLVIVFIIGKVSSKKELIQKE